VGASGVFSYHLTLIGLGDKELHRLLTRTHAALARPPVTRLTPGRSAAFDTPPGAQSTLLPGSIPNSRDAATPVPYQDDVKISWGNSKDN